MTPQFYSFLETLLMDECNSRTEVRSRVPEAFRQVQEALENGISHFSNGRTGQDVKEIISLFLGREVMTDDDMIRKLDGKFISDEKRQLAEINSPAPRGVDKAKGNGCTR